MSQDLLFVLIYWGGGLLAFPFLLRYHIRDFAKPRNHYGDKQRAAEPDYKQIDASDIMVCAMFAFFGAAVFGIFGLIWVLGRDVWSKLDGSTKANKSAPSKATDRIKNVRSRNKDGAIRVASAHGYRVGRTADAVRDARALAKRSAVRALDRSANSSHAR